jgi:hypothetical protein
MNEPQPLKRPACRFCNQLSALCDCAEKSKEIVLTEWQQKKIEQNKRAIYESRKRDLADLRMFPLRD